MFQMIVFSTTHCEVQATPPTVRWASNLHSALPMVAVDTNRFVEIFFVFVMQCKEGAMFLVCTYNVLS